MPRAGAFTLASWSKKERAPSSNRMTQLIFRAERSPIFLVNLHTPSSMSISSACSLSKCLPTFVARNPCTKPFQSRSTRSSQLVENHWLSSSRMLARMGWFSRAGWFWIITKYKHLKSNSEMLPVRSVSKSKKIRQSRLLKVSLPTSNFWPLQQHVNCGIILVNRAMRARRASRATREERAIRIICAVLSPKRPPCRNHVSLKILTTATLSSRKGIENKYPCSPMEYSVSSDAKRKKTTVLTMRKARSQSLFPKA
mmetsp:Transcript_7696/g.24504  ORF Transcript_7696/g.24504 Transcript_7696/m.24504 type:complete len:255 (+) Transcript_7696:1595-2359(+)